MVSAKPSSNTVSVNVNPSTSSTNVYATNNKSQYYADLAQASANDAANSAVNAGQNAAAAAQSAENATIAAANAQNSAIGASASEDNAKVWAEGTDEQVEALGGTHSSKGWVDYVMENAPTATIEQTETGATLTVTDIHGTTTADISNGEDGAPGEDGFSPSATVSKVGNTATITITDKDGTTTANIYDGVGSITDVTVNGTSVLDGSVAKVVVPTDNSQLTNGAGYAVASSLATVATSGSYADLSNKPTIPSTASDVGALPDSTKYGADLSYSSNTLQLLDQDGNNLGNSVTIQSSPDIDGITITKNSDDELQTVAVIDQNNTSNGIKTWTGTRAEYDAIVTKDADTLYNVIDDTDTINATTRVIGEIVTSTIPLTDAGLHLLDGALISGGGSYAEFVTYIAGLVAGYPDLFCTEADWQQSISDYGVCGKFVYDSLNNTVRLPKITGFIEGTTDLTALGDLVEAGLPNINGYTDWWSYGYGTSSDNMGAFYNVAPPSEGNGVTTFSAPGNKFSQLLRFDASRSNSIYNNSSTVQPQSIKVLYYIAIATTYKTEIQVDIDEIATDLNSKADTDLTNCTDVANIKMAHNSMPSLYTALTIGSTGASYTAPADGYFVSHFNCTNAQIGTWVNTSTGVSNSGSTAGSYAQVGCSISVKKGDIVVYHYNHPNTTYKFGFVYAVGSESEAS